MRPTSSPDHDASGPCRPMYSIAPYVFPAWPSSVATHLMNGAVTGRPIGNPFGSHPPNRTGPRASAHEMNAASSLFARPFARLYTARRITRRPCSSMA